MCWPMATSHPSVGQGPSHTRWQARDCLTFICRLWESHTHMQARVCYFQLQVNFYFTLICRSGTISHSYRGFGEYHPPTHLYIRGCPTRFFSPTSSSHCRLLIISHPPVGDEIISKIEQRTVPEDYAMLYIVVDSI